MTDYFTACLEDFKGSLIYFCYPCKGSNNYKYYNTYCADDPASTRIAVPVIVDVVSDARNKHKAAMVSTGINSFIACFARITF
jgi:hypothetical protein